MISATGAEILAHLDVVRIERTVRAADAGLAARVGAIKCYQQRRFELTYADLLVHPRYAGASRFFLEELYGPTDFTQRDAQFARVVPGLARMFPAEVVDTVRTLAELHALSERFDTRMARDLGSPEVDRSAYVRAWQTCNEAPSRDRQIDLLLRVGRDLDRLTRSALLRHSLRLMRAPARAAGLVALQSFLECGFDTFRAMHGADEFLAIVEQRERSLAAILFAADAQDPDRLGQLP